MTTVLRIGHKLERPRILTKTHSFLDSPLILPGSIWMPGLCQHRPIMVPVCFRARVISRDAGAALVYTWA